MKCIIDDFTRLISHTNLHADTSNIDMKKLCNEAKKYHSKTVATNQVQAKFCSEQLKGTDIDTGAAVAFPLGQQTIVSRIFDTKDAAKNDTDGINYVIGVTGLKGRDYAYIRDEMKQMVALCHKYHVPYKVVFENYYLAKDKIKELAEVVKEAKPGFIKTSTGLGPSGAKVKDAKLMKSVVDEDAKVKAAGGVRNSGGFLAIIRAGADRIGCSAGVKITEALKQRMQDDNVTAIEINR